MIFDLISFLGAIGASWEIPSVTLRLVEDDDASEDNMFVVTGTSSEGHVWRRFLIRPKYLEYVLSDWGKGEGLKRLFARYPVLSGRAVHEERRKEMV